MNEMFSYDRFEDYYEYIFLNKDEENREKVFYNLFTNIIYNITKIKFNLEYDIQKLSKEDIREALESLKEAIDTKFKDLDI